jgi:hypothetical protein
MVKCNVYAEDRALSRRVGGTLASGTPLGPIETTFPDRPREGETIFLVEGWAGMTVKRSYMIAGQEVVQISVETVGWSDESLLRIGFKAA